MIATKDDETKNYVLERSRQPLFFLFILGFVGSLISLVLLKEKYAEGPSSCDISSAISCTTINKGPYSLFFGVPIAAFGLVWNLILLFFVWRTLLFDGHFAYFITAILLWALSGGVFVVNFSCFLSFSQRKRPSGCFSARRSLASLFFILFSRSFFTKVYLLGVELYLRVMCPMCTLIHVLIGLIIFLSVKLYNKLPGRPSTEGFIQALKPYAPLLIMLLVLPVLFFNLPVLASSYQGVAESSPLSSRGATEDLPPIVDQDEEYMDEEELEEEEDDREGETGGEAQEGEEEQRMEVVEEDTRSPLERCFDSEKGRALQMWGAEYCSYCQKQKSILKARGVWHMVNYIDCEKEEARCRAQGIQKFPTWIKVDLATGKEKQRRTGVTSPSELMTWIGCVEDSN
ncbi:hypothetical protein QOT17_007547 [Balamuthia mandrillaris]